MPWRRHDAYELVLGVFFGTPTHGDKAQSPERCERYSPAAPSMPSAPSIGSMPSAPSMPSPTMPVQPMSMQAHIQAQIQFQAQMQAQAHQAGCRLLRLGGQPFLPLFRAALGAQSGSPLHPARKPPLSRRASRREPGSSTPRGFGRRKADWKLRESSHGPGAA
ncbi:unnamed protein product [Effrenium voratum]|nr:unnamed protein product [Effrenium voratum]